MLSTIHRRHLLAFLEIEKQTTLKKLKETFVESGDMNATTLYRTLERFKNEHLIHEVETPSDRIFLRCSGDHKDAGVKISQCLGCDTITESHFPLPPDTIEATLIEKKPHCTTCNQYS